MLLIHFFFFTAPATTEIYTLSLHDALPIFNRLRQVTSTIKQDGANQVSIITNTDRKSTRLNSSHITISYAVFCLKKKITLQITIFTFFSGILRISLA